MNASGNPSANSKLPVQGSAVDAWTAEKDGLKRATESIRRENASTGTNRAKDGVGTGTEKEDKYLPSAGVRGARGNFIERPRREIKRPKGRKEA